MKIIKSEKFNKWYKKLGDIFELKFKSGLRVYYALDGKKLILLLNGGGKNTKRDQSNDIDQANQIYQEYLDGK